jgi:hypothetical protein
VVGFAGDVDVPSGGFDAAGGLVGCSEDGTAVEDVAVPEEFENWVSVGDIIGDAA